MNVFSFKTLFLFFLLALIPMKAPAAPAYETIENLLKSASGDKEMMCQSLKTLSQELRRYPDDPELLRMRVNAYRTVGDYFSAKDDAYKLAKMFPGFTPYQTLHCMMMESAGGEEKDYVACYRKVLASFGSSTLKEKDPNGYILMLLLAEDPQGEELRKQKTDSLTHSEGYNLVREQLLHFDRRKILPRIETRSQWVNPCEN